MPRIISVSEDRYLLALHWLSIYPPYTGYSYCSTIGAALFLRCLLWLMSGVES